MANIRRFVFTMIMLGIFSPSAAQSPPSKPAPVIRSATKARDIGGFALGMRIADVKKIVPVTRFGDGNFEATRDGITYDFGVTRLGRIFRIASTQTLGRFEVDATFRRNLMSKLTAKYGPPTDSTTGTFNWTLVEPVAQMDRRVLPFTTMWAYAYTTTGNEGVTLVVKMLDFRIMWADEAKANQRPRERAENAVSF